MNNTEHSREEDSGWLVLSGPFILKPYVLAFVNMKLMLFVWILSVFSGYCLNDALIEKKSIMTRNFQEENKKKKKDPVCTNIRILISLLSGLVIQIEFK